MTTICVADGSMVEYLRRKWNIDGLKLACCRRFHSALNSAYHFDVNLTEANFLLYRTLTKKSVGIFRLYIEPIKCESPKHSIPSGYLPIIKESTEIKLWVMEVKWTIIDWYLTNHLNKLICRHSDSSNLANAGLCPIKYANLIGMIVSNNWIGWALLHQSANKRTSE